MKEITHKRGCKNKTAFHLTIAGEHMDRGFIGLENLKQKAKLCASCLYLMLNLIWIF